MVLLMLLGAVRLALAPDILAFFTLFQFQELSDRVAESLSDSFHLVLVGFHVTKLIAAEAARAIDPGGQLDLKASIFVFHYLVAHHKKAFARCPAPRGMARLQSRQT